MRVLIVALLCALSYAQTDCCNSGGKCIEEKWCNASQERCEGKCNNGGDKKWGPPGSKAPPFYTGATSLDSFKVMEWNVYWENHDNNQVAQVVNKNKPDIWFANEPLGIIGTIGSYIGMKCENNCKFEGYGSYIFYRPQTFDHIESGASRIHASSCGSKGGDRANNWMVVKHKKTGNKLILAGLHTSAGQGVEGIQKCETKFMTNKINELKGKYSGAPVIWSGDMNAPKDGGTMQKAMGSEYEYLENNRAGTMVWWCDKAIDHIVGTKGKFEKIAGGLTGDGGSCQSNRPPWGSKKADHLPIYAVVKFKGASQAPDTGDSPAPETPQNPVVLDPISDDDLLKSDCCNYAGKCIEDKWCSQSKEFCEGKCNPKGDKKWGPEGSTADVPSDNPSPQPPQNPVAPQPNPTPTDGSDESISASGWNLVWSDEFDSLDATKSKWTSVNAGGGFGNNEKQFYRDDDKNRFVRNGKLVIKAEKKWHEGSNYVSAKLTSKQNWKYGWFKIKAKLVSGRGTWPAIWMMPTKAFPPKWPLCGEIDIMEHVGMDMNKIHCTIHTDSFNHMKNTQISRQMMVNDVSTAFHEYQVLWTKDWMKWFIDDKCVIQISRASKWGTNEWPFDNSNFYLILNLAVGGNWGGQQGIDDSVFPKEFEIDWARVYQGGDVSSVADISCPQGGGGDGGQFGAGDEECCTHSGKCISDPWCNKSKDNCLGKCNAGKDNAWGKEGSDSGSQPETPPEPVVPVPEQNDDVTPVNPAPQPAATDPGTNPCCMQDNSCISDTWCNESQEKCMGPCNDHKDKQWGTPPPPDPNAFKVMSYNVEYKGFSDGRINDYANQIKKVGAAVVGTQETQDRYGLERKSSPYKLVPNTDFQNPIYYHPSLVDFAGKSGMMTITKDQIAVDNHIDRTITWANFKWKASGQEFWFFNTHLPHPTGPASSRNTHARIAKSLLEKRKALGAGNMPTVVVCDCNSFASDGNTEGRFRDVLSRNGIPTAYTAKGHPGHGGIDHIFLSTQFEKLRGYDSGTGKSDHTSITVEAKFKASSEEESEVGSGVAILNRIPDPFTVCWYYQPSTYLVSGIVVLVLLAAVNKYYGKEGDVYQALIEAPECVEA